MRLSRVIRGGCTGRATGRTVRSGAGRKHLLSVARIGSEGCDGTALYLMGVQGQGEASGRRAHRHVEERFGAEDTAHLF
jgi:hypothetical protein